MPLPGGSEGSILVVCTGNICRSPYIEARLAEELAGTHIAVSSAGTQAVVGSDMDPQSRALLEARGVAVPAFTARQLTADLIAGADLVIAATREHLAQVAQTHPKALRTGLSLIDLHDLLEGPPPSETPLAQGGNAVSRVAEHARSRRHLVNARQGDEADVVDPIGQSRTVFAQMAAQVEAALPTVVAALRAERPR